MRPSWYGPKRKWIYLLYTLAVLVQGIMLGFLAFRGIRNDHALREKQQKQELELLSRSVFSRLDEALVSFFPDSDHDTIFSSISDSVILLHLVKTDTAPVRVIESRLAWLPEEYLPLISFRISFTKSSLISISLSSWSALRPMTYLVLSNDQVTGNSSLIPNNQSQSPFDLLCRR